MTQIYAISDMHGMLPEPKECPECDILLIAGDVCPDFLPSDQFKWLDHFFRAWLRELPARFIVGIAGNHDFVFQNRMSIDALFLPWIYLEDGSSTIEDITIYGTPWVPNLASWAFYGTAAKLDEVYGKIPLATDIVLSHGPPLDYGDLTDAYHGSNHVGSEAATAMIKRVNPEIFVCGHIHEARGNYHADLTEIYNVSSVDAEYKPVQDRFISVWDT